MGQQKVVKVASPWSISRVSVVTLWVIPDVSDTGKCSIKTNGSDSLANTRYLCKCHGQFAHPSNGKLKKLLDINISDSDHEKLSGKVIQCMRHL